MIFFNLNIDKLSELNKEETFKESDKKEKQESKYSNIIKETNKPKIINSVYNDEKTQKKNNFLLSRRRKEIWP